MSEKISSNKRKYIRFEPDDLGFAFLDLSVNGDFEPELGALVYEEGFGGCGLLMVKSKCRLSLNQVLRIKIDSMPIMNAEVRWVKDVDDLTLRAGISYIHN
ncbi:MAG: hypothetical protein CR997_07735 [Acidobacteria bacterium]|nr:MAG: hypothetical protein CR997_07735 [Acidobacteriota bacterium]